MQIQNWCEMSERETKLEFCAQNPEIDLQLLLVGSVMAAVFKSQKKKIW